MSDVVSPGAPAHGFLQDASKSFVIPASAGMTALEVFEVPFKD